MSDAMHCDRKGCDTWTDKPENAGFVAVHWWGDYSSRMDFCSWACVVAHGTTKPPLVVVPND